MLIRKFSITQLLVLGLYNFVIAQSSSFLISWTPGPEVDLSYYSVFRSTIPYASQLIAVVNHPDSSYRDGNIQRGVRYYYRVKAINNAFAQSDYSDEVSAAIPQISGLAEAQQIVADQIINISLDPLVSDPDNSDQSISWTFSGNNRLNVSITNHVAAITAPGDWTEAQEQITFTATDPNGFFDKVTVNFVSNLPTDITESTFAGPVNVAFFGSKTNCIFSWVTLKESMDYIEYGADTTYGLTTEIDTEFLTDHEQILGSLAKKSTYHYRIVSQDINGKISFSKDAIITTGVDDEVNVFPIPYQATEDVEGNGIYFTNLPVNSSIGVYNIAGEPVYRKDKLSNVFGWQVQNNAGKNISSGLYVYIVKDEKNKKITSGKLIIVR